MFLRHLIVPGVARATRLPCWTAAVRGMKGMPPFWTWFGPHRRHGTGFWEDPKFQEFIRERVQQGFGKWANEMHEKHDVEFLKAREEEEVRNTEVVQASVGSGGLRLKLNVSHYEPEELSIKVVGNHLVISGKHPKRSDEHGFVVAREFTRELLIPEEVDMDTLTSLRTEDGLLVISARVKAELRAKGRSIAIEREATDKDGKD